MTEGKTITSTNKQTEKKKVEIKGLLTCAGKIMESGACASELKDLLQDYCDELSSKYEQMNQGGTAGLHADE